MYVVITLWICVRHTCLVLYLVIGLGLLLFVGVQCFSSISWLVYVLANSWIYNLTDCRFSISANARLKKEKKLSEHNLDILPLLYFLKQARYLKCIFNLSFLLIFISSIASFLGLLMFVHHTAAAAAQSSLF